VTGVFDGIGLTRPLWPHQVRALAALDRDVARGDRATYLVVPPGGGKTLIGLEAARRLGRPTVVLCPNTAIQAQWMAQWQASFGPDVVPATASRELPTPLTVLTYQALCTLGAAGNGEEAAQGPRPRLSTEGVLSLLHPNGRALIARLQAGGPAFEHAWNTRVGPGSVVYAGSPEGTGILAAQRGDDPFALTTQIRTLWR
jgi:hypothetical protein